MEYIAPSIPFQLSSDAWKTPLPCLALPCLALPCLALNTLHEEPLAFMYMHATLGRISRESMHLDDDVQFKHSQIQVILRRYNNKDVPLARKIIP